MKEEKHRIAELQRNNSTKSNGSVFGALLGALNQSQKNVTEKLKQTEISFFPPKRKEKEVSTVDIPFFQKERSSEVQTRSKSKRKRGVEWPEPGFADLVNSENQRQTIDLSNEDWNEKSGSPFLS